MEKVWDFPSTAHVSISKDFLVLPQIKLEYVEKFGIIKHLFYDSVNVSHCVKVKYVM